MTLSYGVMFALVPLIAISQLFYFLAVVGMGGTFIVCYGAAVVVAAQDIAVGKGSVRYSFGRATSRFWWLLGAYIGVIIIGIIPAILSVFLVGIPLLIWLGVALLFVAQAVLVEEVGPVQSISRSWNLVKGNWWRSFGNMLLVAVAYYGITIVITLPFLILPLFTDLDTGVGIFIALLIGSLIIWFLLLVVLMPFFFIVPTLLYLDFRATKENYNKTRLAMDLGIPSGAERLDAAETT